MEVEIEQDLRFTSDEMLRALERLRELEERKRKLTPGTKSFLKLAEEVEQLAATVFERTREQTLEADRSVALRERAGMQPRPIDEIPPTRELHIILAEWRDAERRLAEAVPHTTQASEAEADVERLRLEYRRAAQSAWTIEERQ